MSFLASLILRRVLPNTLPLINRTVISTGIVGSLYRQPLYRLVPLLIDLYRTGDTAWIVSPLKILIPTVTHLPFIVVRRLIISAVFYRFIANIAIGLITWPLRTLFADILLMQTPVRNVDWFKELNKIIYNNLKSLLSFCNSSADTMFSFTIDHGWLSAIALSLAGILVAYYKYENISEFFKSLYENHPNFFNFFKSVGRALYPTIGVISGSVFIFVKNIFIASYATISVLIRSTGYIIYDTFHLVKEHWCEPMFILKVGIKNIASKIYNIVNYRGYFISLISKLKSVYNWTVGIKMNSCFKIS